MEFTTCFALHSQTTRLKENGSYARAAQAQTGVSPSMLSSSKELIPSSRTDHASIDYNSPRKTCAEILSLSSSRFTRRY
eukprot:NODE_1978_length_687_cov_403.891850_g1546_i0.p2 GENE.NODE_1978_length_687_cov_403.891850_g1546_i0~~NODE_1978_length_687_cov_403.891850_g1546_i0.p2  ORF type:complete len:79 (+),score=4.11 NODE_1978_length_687_cov_403.891850_g1546_i0:409-645(+)